jgi:pimeloyl-ACP methyl ester carboxylesterase
MDINGHKLHVNKMGSLKENTVPVIIEPGTGNFSLDWIEVQQELSRYTQVITYDRPSNGWSEPSTNRYSVQSALDDIKTIIDKTGMKKPVILIGHSTGGLYTRLFMQKYPDYVAGMILVDARNEYFAEKLPEFNKKFFQTQGQGVNKLMSMFGIVRLLGASFLPSNFPKSISKTEYVNVHWDQDFFTEVEQEMKEIPNAEKLLIPTRSLGDTPLTIITAEENHIAVVPLGFSQNEEKLVNETWKQSQKWLSALSSNSEYIVVPKASHAIMYDNPEIIVTSVLNMFKKLK